MTTENALTVVDPNSVLTLVESGFLGLDLREAEGTISWVEIREAIEPQGEMVEAEKMDGWHFTLERAKPIASSYGGQTDHFYWIVGRKDDDTLFNTAIGGKACVEILDGLLRLAYAYRQARQSGDDQQMRYLEEIGAGKKIDFTFRVKKGGKYGRYYIFE